MQKTQNDVSIDAIASGFQFGFGERAGISTCLESAIASGFRYSIGEMAGISSRGGRVCAFTYDYVKTRPEHPAPHDLLSSDGGNKVCFATTPPDMEASCIKKQQNGYDSRYTFSAKELDDETQYSYFGARYYDSDLSVWLSVDAASDMYPSTSPYMYVRGNPVMRIDPNGMWDTDYYDIATGEHISHVDDGIDEAVAISRMTYDALKESDGKVTNRSAKQVGGVSLGSNSAFQEIAGTVYGEMDAKRGDLGEAAGIACTLENRSNNGGGSVLGEARRYGVYGHSKWAGIKTAKTQGANDAYRGTMLMMATDIDFSNGATSWQGRDFRINGSAAKKFYYDKGFKFTDPAHDIYKMGDNPVPTTGTFGNYQYKYESTAASGGTIFMKLTDAFIQANWPNYSSGDKKSSSMW